MSQFLPMDLEKQSHRMLPNRVASYLSENCSDDYDATVYLHSFTLS